jgi:thioredoxin reductase (NADPH)
MIVLTVLSRPGCHLCEELISELDPLLSGRARIDVVDISDDEALLRRYCLEIPVLLHGDEELSRYRLDRERLQDFFLRQTG